MKKTLLAFILMIALSLSIACVQPLPEESNTAEESEESPEQEHPVIRIAGMTGPTTMGLVRLLEQNDAFESVERYDFTLAGSADEITPKLIQGELDMAAIPANLASVLYNNTEGKIVVLAVNTLGVLYVLERGNSVTDWASLKGKTIYASGKGSTPEYTLRYLLSANGIDPDKDVTLEFKSEPTEVVALINEHEDAVAMLPQPYVTVAMSKVSDLHMVMNLSEEWEKITGKSLITGVLVARADFVAQNPEVTENFLQEYEASIAYANSNIEETATLCETYGVVKAAIAGKALPYCNITFLSGASMKASLSAYLEVLYEQNPKSVGGKLPGDSFYYE